MYPQEKENRTSYRGVQKRAHSLPSALQIGYIPRRTKGMVMTKKVAVMLANGFEPVEAIAPVDAMRRAGLAVTTMSIHPTTRVQAAQDVVVEADQTLSETDLMAFDAILIPGGSQGVENLKACKELSAALPDFMANKYVFSICAGPTVLNVLGLLEGKKATCYPGCEVGFPAGTYQEGLGVVVDNNLVTASGPGQALAFGIACVDALLGGAVAHEIASGMLIAGY